MTDVNEIIRKTQGAQYANGLLELMLGVFMLISAMSIELIDNPLISGAVAVLGILVAARFFEKLRMQVSVPRTGYARFPEEVGQGRLWNILTAIGIFIVVMGMFIWLLYTQPDNALAWLALLVGMIIGLALLTQGLRLRLWRLVFHGILSLALGISLSPLVLGADFSPGFTGVGLMSVFFFLMGISLAVSGWIMLSRFIKSHPLKQEANDER